MYCYESIDNVQQCHILKGLTKLCLLISTESQCSYYFHFDVCYATKKT